MEMRQEYSQHIKDEFFDLVQDKKNPKTYWMIPISSHAEKYKGIIEKKKKRYGKYNNKM